MEEDRDFDFICRWCAGELIGMTETFSDPFSVPKQTWYHVPAGQRSYELQCPNGLHAAEPTRWTVAG